MTEKIQKELLNVISYVSGVAGFAHADLSKSNKALTKDEMLDSFTFNETKKGWKVSSGVIVDMSIRTKTIVFEIHSSITSILKKHNIKIDEIVIYIRGIK